MQPTPLLPRALMAYLLAAPMAGCAYQAPRTQSTTWASASTEGSFNVGAKQLVESVKSALNAPPLSLPVASQQDGTLTTDWKEYPGDVHIVRRWFERTRFRVSITPDFSDPTNKSRLTIADQTEERATESQPWYPAPQTRRPDRSAEVVKQIQAQLSRATTQP